MKTSMCKKIFIYFFLEMAETKQEFFEPHEIADLEKAFHVDVEAENDFLKGKFCINRKTQIVID